MFPEYRDLISRLMTSDSRFAHLFDRHHLLDRKIENMESGSEPASHQEIERLKKEKLQLKDQLYDMLKKGDAAGS